MINVIYDNRWSNDHERLIKEFEIQKVDFKFWDAVRLTESVVKSINASHKMIVRWAKENNQSECIIAEQDLMFTSPYSWEYFMEQKPNEFDIYLWGSYIIPLSNNCICGFHLYIIHSKFYDQFLSVPDDVHIDVEMDKLKGDYKFCHPFPALQRVGFSANNCAVCDYNKQLPPEYIYK